MIQNFPDLPKSSADEISALLEFCRSLVFKDSAKAETAETLLSSKAAYNLISAELGFTPFDESSDPTGEMAQNEIDDYVETNEYYVTYLENLGLRESGTLETSDQYKMVVAVVKARTADDHEIIFYPESFDRKLRGLFLDFFNTSLHYYNSVLHNEGLGKYERYWNYVNFVVSIMTLERMITARMDLAFDIDAFDERSIRNMFASYGLDFFEIVPDKYRRRILKNINYLLEHKGTTQALVNVMQIFGFDDIKLFKYYLVKDFAREGDGSISMPPNSYLQFAQVEHDEENLEAAFLSSTTKWETFDSVTGSDPYWHATEEEIAVHDFTYLNTKYLGIDVSIDMLKSTLNHSYFYNYLYQFKKAGDLAIPGNYKMTVQSSKISGEPIHILDMMIALHALTMEIMGWEDVIVKDYYQVAYTFANAHRNKPTFQEDDQAAWDVDLPASSEGEKAAAFMGNIENLLGVDWDDVDIATLRDDVRTYLESLPDRGDLTPGENSNYDSADLDGKETTPYDFVRTYQDNLKYAAKLRQLMIDETNKSRYEVLKDIYNYKFIAQFNTELFSGYDTYAEYLAAESPGLYAFISGKDSNDALYDIITLIDNFIDDADVIVETFAGDTGLIDGEMSVTNNMELFNLTRTFIKMMVDTFKAYTTQLREFSVYYVHRDPFDDRIHLFDELTLGLHGGFYGTDTARISDDGIGTAGGQVHPRFLVSVEYSDEIGMYDNYLVEQGISEPPIDYMILDDNDDDLEVSVRTSYALPLDMSDESDFVIQLGDLRLDPSTGQPVIGSTWYGSIRALDSMALISILKVKDYTIRDELLDWAEFGNMPGEGDAVGLGDSLYPSIRLVVAPGNHIDEQPISVVDDEPGFEPFLLSRLSPGDGFKWMDGDPQTDTLDLTFWDSVLTMIEQTPGHAWSGDPNDYLTNLSFHEASDFHSRLVRTTEVARTRDAIEMTVVS